MTNLRARRVNLSEAALQSFSPELANFVMVRDAVQHQSTVNRLLEFHQAYREEAKRIWKIDPPSFAHRVGLKETIGTLVSEDWNSSAEAFCRIDYLLLDGLPKVLEMNFGSSVGGSLDYESIQFEASSRQTFTPNLSRIDALIESLPSEVRREVIIPIWEWLASRDYESYLLPIKKHLERRGFSTRYVSLDDLYELSPGTFPTPGIILRLFALQDAIAHGYDPVKLYMPAKNNGWYWLGGEESTALSSKAILASRTLQARFSDVLPHTAIIGERDPQFLCIDQDSVIRKKNQLVLKPVDELGGLGVVFGKHCTIENWTSTVSKYASGEAIVQNVAHSDSIDTEGSTIKAVLGQYVAGTTYQGTLVRYVENPRDTVQVINGHNGAYISILIEE